MWHFVTASLVLGHNVLRGIYLMFTDQIAAYLQTTNTAATRQLYHLALSQFQAWYTAAYAAEPDASLLTEEEAREWRNHLSGGQRLSAATVNQRLAALRGIAQHCPASRPSAAHTGCETNAAAHRHAQRP
jgi:hypothetical protein